MTSSRRATQSAPSNLSRIILWGGFCVLVALTLYNLYANPITFALTQIDEQGHFSYALHLIMHQRWWPDFSDFRMFNVPTGIELTALNYINHPPTFYWLAKLIDILLPWWEPMHLRALSFTFYLLAMLLYTRIGTRLHFTPSASILYALMPLLLYMHLQIGFYNNDTLCVLGGMVATSASLRWLGGEQPTRAWVWMGIGALLASVKLTALLLVGLYVLVCLVLRRGQLRSIPLGGWLYGVAIAALCVAPYLYMTAAYGSPAPNTAGQLALLADHPTCHTAPALRMDWIAWLPFFFAKFADQHAISETTFFPIIFYGAALVALAFKWRAPSLNAENSGLHSVAFASAFATLATLAIHTIFSWQRHRDFGWICDSLLRYYLPLIAAYAAVSAHTLTRLAFHTRASHE